MRRTSSFSLGAGPFRVAFVAANRERLPEPVEPLGLLYVMAAVATEHRTTLWDLCFEPRPLAALRTHLNRFEPQVVCIGLRTIESAEVGPPTQLLDYYREVVDGVRAWHPGVPVIVGGAAFSAHPAEVMRALRPDFGIVGEGELPLRLLLSTLVADGPLDAVDGLYVLDGDEVVGRERRTFIAPTTLPAPEHGRIDPRHDFLGGTVCVQTKRGCPGECAYCAYPDVAGRDVRTRQPLQVASEIAALGSVRPGASHLFIVDASFNRPADHAAAVCKALLSVGVVLPWTCYVSPIGLDEELAVLMRAAGCVGVEIRAHTATDAGLQRLRKGYGVTELRRAHAILSGAGLKDCFIFILGYPGQSIDEICATLDFVEELDPYAAVLATWSGGETSYDPDITPTPVHCARSTIHAELMRHSPARGRWIIPSLGYNFGRSRLIELRRRGLTGPAWQHLDVAGP